jgi:hypothetical protein
MRHTQSRFPFPRGASFLYPGDASRLVGWDGAGEKGQQQQQPPHPPQPPRLSRDRRARPSHLEPSVAVAEAVRRTGNRRPTTGQTTTGDNETDNSSRSSGGKSAGSNGRTTGSAATEAEPDNSESRSRQKRKRQKLQHSKRQCRSGRPAASAAGRDRHPPRRVLHTPSGKASAAARVARRPHLHSDHLRSE